MNRQKVGCNAELGGRVDWPPDWMGSDAVAKAPPAQATIAEEDRGLVAALAAIRTAAEQHRHHPIRVAVLREYYRVARGYFASGDPLLLEVPDAVNGLLVRWKGVDVEWVTP